MEPHYPLAAGCTMCLELSRHRTRIVHGYGDPQPRVLFIGDAPERRGSDTSGIPFTLSERGQRLQLLLIALRLSRELDPAAPQPQLQGAYLTHLVRCSPPLGRAALEREIAHCASYLWKELELLRPRIIVPIGAIPTRILCEKYLGMHLGAIEEIHAQLYTIPGGFLVPMLDPLAMGRSEALVFTRVMSALLEEGRLDDEHWL